MTRKAIISAALPVALSVYIGVYLVMSLNGHYEPNYNELFPEPDDRNTFLLKSSEPWLWWNFWHTSEKPTTWKTSGNVLTARGYRELWRYPIRGYFDEDTKESRYIETKVSEQAGPGYPPQGVGSPDP
jgi:hypothetical protein